jgi:uncharacterized protein (TIGR02145 family)
MKIKTSSFFIIALLFSACGGSDDSPSTALVNSVFVEDVWFTEVVANAEILEDGGSPVTERGVCISEAANPTIDDEKIASGSGIGGYLVDVDNLESNTTYHIRAYAINEAGVTYSSDREFKTLPGIDAGKLTDIEGNVYHLVEINGVIWTAENLKVTKYRNGDAIPNVMNLDTWGALSDGAYINHDNKTSGINQYGRLYNWFAVTDSRNIAPEGWHVPTEAEWNGLMSFAGKYPGCQLRELNIDDLCVNNATGFSAKTAGARLEDGWFSQGPNGIAMWWSQSATEINENVAVYASTSRNGGSFVVSINDKNNGLSVRLVKN